MSTGRYRGKVSTSGPISRCGCPGSRPGQWCPESQLLSPAEPQSHAIFKAELFNPLEPTHSLATQHPQKWHCAGQHWWMRWKMSSRKCAAQGHHAPRHVRGPGQRTMEVLSAGEARVLPTSVMATLLWRTSQTAMVPSLAPDSSTGTLPRGATTVTRS